MREKTKNEYRALSNFSRTVFLSCVFIFGAAACVYPFAQDKIIAVVNNDIITRKDIDDFENFMRIQMTGEYSEEQAEGRMGALKKDMLNRLIDDRLILQEAKRQGIKIDENRVKAKIDDIKRRFVSDKAFRDSLKAQGLSPADLEARIKEQMLMYAVVEAKVQDKVVVNPAEVTDFYQKYAKEFFTPETRELDLLVADDKETALQIRDRLKQTEDFVAAAREYSLTADKIDMKKGQGEKKVEDVIFKLDVNDISAPLPVEDKYYLFRLNKITPPYQQSLSEVQDNIYQILWNRKMQGHLVKWIDELKKKSYIDIKQN